MRNQERSSQNSKRAYFFGSTAIIAVLMNGGLKSIYLMTQMVIPKILTSSLLFIIIMSLGMGLINVYKSWKEPTSFKKMMGVIFIFGSVVYVLNMILS